MRSNRILAAVEGYYSAKFDEHGATPSGVDWNSAESQELRFERLLELVRRETEPFSINDLGCGFGSLADFLRRAGIEAPYVGYELSEAMLECARSTFRDTGGVRFVHGAELEPTDYSVASGIFNVKLGFSSEEWDQHVTATTDLLAARSRKGFAFNMLSTYSDVERRRPDLHYADPCAVFNRCKKSYSPHVALLHDYGLWEFTIIVRYSP